MPQASGVVQSVTPPSASPDGTLTRHQGPGPRRRGSAVARRQPARRKDPTSNSAAIATVPRRREAPARAVLLATGGIAIEDGITVTRREAEVMECVAAGLSTPQIAAEFGVSRDAIDKCIQRLLISVGMPNRVALAAWWTEVTMDLYAQSADNQ